MSNSYPIKFVLELACAAQRVNNGYIKELIAVTDDNIPRIQYDNKTLIRYALGHTDGYNEIPIQFKPVLLRPLPEDCKFTDDILKFFRRLLFSAVKGDNDFFTDINALLNGETDHIPLNKIGIIACLPSVYIRESSKYRISRAAESTDSEWLGQAGNTLLDLDCEVLEVRRLKNYDAFGVLAIIDNKLASWISKHAIKTGPAVLITAKIKGLSENWATKKPETRLNYVKVAQ